MGKLEWERKEIESDIDELTSIPEVQEYIELSARARDLDSYMRSKKVISESERISRRLKELESIPEVQRYMELRDREVELSDLYRKAKTDEYLSCDHLWVTTFKSDLFPNQKSCGCVKCGFDSRVVFAMNWPFLTEDYQIMYGVIKAHPTVIEGWDYRIECDFDLAKAIYARLKEKYPNISDADAVNYLKFALYCMRTKDTNETRMEGRAKRLNLPVGFNKWKIGDTHSDYSASLR